MKLSSAAKHTPRRSAFLGYRNVRPKKPIRSKASVRPCWVCSVGSKTLRQCHVSEVTGDGAIIISQSALPDRFQLFLASDERTGRSCKAVARSGSEVRVEFLN